MAAASKGVILAAWNSNEKLPDWGYYAVSNHRSYAERWGYEYIFYTAEEPVSAVTDAGFARLSQSWVKVEALLHVVDRISPDFVFYVDLDSIFADFSKSLSDLASSRHPIVVTGDSWDVFNGGHVFLRPNSSSLKFVEDWWSLRLRIFPTIRANQDPSGLVSDQPAMNYLLAGGGCTQADVERSGAKLFNRMNGYMLNSEREHRFFSHVFAPTSRRGALAARWLLGKRARALVGIVPQNRLNAYPVRLPGATLPKRPGLWHFPGQWKSLMMSAPVFR